LVTLPVSVTRDPAVTRRGEIASVRVGAGAIGTTLACEAEVARGVLARFLAPSARGVPRASSANNTGAAPAAPFPKRSTPELYALKRIRPLVASRARWES
jgi:hypothetical protein